MSSVRQWIANGRRGIWVYPLLGLLAIIPEFTGSFRAWIFAVAAILTTLPIVTTVHQWLRPRRLAPLLNMMAGVIFGLTLLMLLALWNVFSRHQSYAVAQAYWFAYVLIGLATFFFAFRYALNRWRPSACALRDRVFEGRLHEAILNEFLFFHPSLTWQRKHWRILVPAAALASVVTLAVVGIGSRDHLWFALSLAGIPIFVPPPISAAVMRWYTWHYLGGRDVEIVLSYG